jgi:hypothetical protein
MEKLYVDDLKAYFVFTIEDVTSIVKCNYLKNIKKDNIL